MQRSMANEAGTLLQFLRSLAEPAQVAVEACGSGRRSRVVRPKVERLVMVHPARVKAIAAARLNRARWLQTFPGIGAYSAMVILAEIGDIRRFATKRALASYAGLVPRVRESAGKRSYGGITRESRF